MQKTLLIVVVAFFLAVSLSYSTINSKQFNAVVEGVVIADNTGKPLSRVHVYIVDGEEEALTNSKGEFRIETAGKFPLTIYADHEGYQKFRAIATSAGQKQLIRLKSN